MKYTNNILIILCLLLVGCGSYRQTWDKRSIKVDRLGPIVTDGVSFPLNFDIHIPEELQRPGRAVILETEIYSDDNCWRGLPIMVGGEQESTSVERRLWFEKRVELKGQVINWSEMSGSELTVSTTVPYESWMVNSCVRVTARVVTADKECFVVEEEWRLPIDWFSAYIDTSFEKLSPEHKSITRDYFPVYFKKNSIEILNPEVLSQWSELIRSTKSEVFIEVSSSPEGDVSSVAGLTEKRIACINETLQEARVCKCSYKIRGVESWNMLEELQDRDPMTVSNLIDNYYPLARRASLKTKYVICKGLSADAKSYNKVISLLHRGDLIMAIELAKTLDCSDSKRDLLGTLYLVNGDIYNAGKILDSGLSVNRAILLANSGRVEEAIAVLRLLPSSCRNRALIDAIKNGL